MEITKQLEQNAGHVAGVLKQLANQNRLMILCVLTEGEISVTELNKRVPLSQSALSQHLAKLRAANIVTTRRESQTIYYQVADEKIKALMATLYQQYCV